MLTKSLSKQSVQQSRINKQAPPISQKESSIAIGARIIPSPNRLSPADVAWLQRTIGNQAVGALIHKYSLNTNRPASATDTDPISLNQVQTKTQNEPQAMLQRSEDNREGMEESGDEAAPVGDMLCEIMPDSWVVASVKAYFGLRYPTAKKHLDYYLAGKGGEYHINVSKMFRDNPTISKKIAKDIKEHGGRSGKFYGVGHGGFDPEPLPPIRQSDYDSEDWRLALGNIDEVNFEILGEPDNDGNTLVQIEIRDPYEWHPKEDRGTQCLHETMEAQKKNGAKDFLAVGSATIRLKLNEDKK